MLAILSDAHGNAVALEAVLADLKQFPVDGYICLGDMISFGPQGSECLRLIKSLNCPLIMGNTDAYLLKPRTLDDVENPTEDTAFILELENWSAEQLAEADRAAISRFKSSHSFSYDGLTILAYHGSPKSYHDAIVATTATDVLEGYFEASKERPPQLFMGGHTHTQFIRRHYASHVMNPGSIGLPFFTFKDEEAVNPILAEYALLDVLDGAPQIYFRRVPYNLESLVDSVKASHMLYADKWLSGFQRSIKALNT